MLNFGSIFEEAYGSIDPKKKTENDFGSIKKMDLEMEKINDTIKKTNKTIEHLDTQISQLAEGDQRRIDLEKKKDTLIEKEILLDEKRNKIFDKALKLETQALKMKQGIDEGTIGAREDTANVFADVIGKKLKENMEKLISELHNPATSGGVNNNAAGGLGAMAKDMAKDFGGFLKSFGGGVGNIITGSLKSVLGPWGAFIDILIQGIGQAYKQALELNRLLMQNAREMGGRSITGGGGFDSTGNSFGSGSSLRTKAVGASVDESDITTSIAGLSKSISSFGDSKKEIASTKRELIDFGVESARLKKFYNADIGPAVGGMVKTLGVSVKDATKNLTDGVMKAKAAGLDTGIFAERAGTKLPL